MTSPTPQWLPWRTAMQQALYGSGGFFTRERPADHFSTSVHVSPLYARAVAELLCRVDSALGHPADLVFTDMAAGRGELCAGVLDALPSSVAARVRAYAVELAPRPAGLDPRVTWTAQPPDGVRGLLFANEWLDNVPLDVAEADEDGAVRYVEVSTADGAERLGAQVGGADLRWLRRWWPRIPPGGRAEIGRTRDEAWAAAAGTLADGLAVAVDYSHELARRPEYGTLTGYRAGRQVPPVPDGSCDLTAHVAADSLPGATPVPQRTALRALGVTAARPPLSLATTAPAAYVQALAAATQAATLTSPSALGTFTWSLTPTPPLAAVASALT
ncbi:SAM-dependent methyltransferase, MidA family [Actinacidiphila bryophytorum]|uniref:SAM-dependent methyltransferase, MidA family n=3 Tax=Actinacidiphila bryophytorum TaxID=1436133 RepID=A0A9W4M9F5_9ACTN|nr:SAM-dependent methyltransferase, MidA family [Actinacidiphila bryophytorum]